MSSKWCIHNCSEQFCFNEGTANVPTEPEVPATVPESQLCADFTNTSSHLFTCTANLATNPSTACSGDCRSTLEGYVDECLNGAAADAFKNNINIICGRDTGDTGDDSNDAATVEAALISSIS